MDLKKYVCIIPFGNLEFHGVANLMCCPSWLLKYLPTDVPINELWNSEEAIEIRKSVIDGTYRYCDKTQCPYLSQLLSSRANHLGPMVHVNSLPSFIRKYVEKQDGLMDEGPKLIQMSFDRSCNLNCPSCRSEYYTANKEEIKNVKETINEIEATFSKDLLTMYTTGSGDPFVSVALRDYLRNFDPKKYPKLKKVHIHTNANMWTPKMWDSMKSIHPYVKTCEISVNAGCKETYENKIRLGGNWNKLIENLKFINTIPKLKHIKASFVVEQSNYKEIPVFLELMKEIFGKKVEVFFGKINRVGYMSEEDYKLTKVWDKDHPDFNDFLKVFNKVCYDGQVFHNMHDLISVNKKLI